jgi:quercetin dioxygenase-like cupin family protein
MQITRSSIETTLGPAEWFTGSVYIDAVAAPSGASRVSASSVHFTPGARTAWHTHPNGQTVYVLEGIGLAQSRGGPIEVIRPGDRVFFEPGEDHWHGATANRFMTHLAMLDVGDDGAPATWGDHVTDEEYGAAPLAYTKAVPPTRVVAEPELKKGAAKITDKFKDDKKQPGRPALCGGTGPLLFSFRTTSACALSVLPDGPWHP